MSYSLHLNKNKQELSSSALTSNNSVHRFKSIKSASSPQQLNEIVTQESGHNNHLSIVNQSPIIELVAGDNYFDSFSFSPGRHLVKSSVNKNNCTHRLSHVALNRTEKESKERKWMSLWSMRNLNESFMSEEKTAKKKHSTASSIISTFYRNSNGNNKLSYSRREVKKAQKLFFIVVFFMLCWLPLYTSNTIQAFCHHCPTPSTSWLDFLIILSHINSAGSPFLYAFHMKDFRQALRRLICKGAINKRKLRDLRREELFSISGRRQCNIGMISVGKPEPVAESPAGSDYYLNKDHAKLCSRSNDQMVQCVQVKIKRIKSGNQSK